MCFSIIYETDKEDIIRWGEQQLIEKPKIIIDYNKYMNDVVKYDRYLAPIIFGKKLQIGGNIFCASFVIGSNQLHGNLFPLKTHSWLRNIKLRKIV